jgi:hypothetical protein
MENHNLWWENSLFLWPCSIAFCIPGRVVCSVPTIFWKVVRWG